MAQVKKFDSFAIGRSVQPASIEDVHTILSENLDAHGDRRLLQSARLSLFKLSMLSRDARKLYRPPTSSEIESRTIDQIVPTWDPFNTVRFHAIAATAVRGALFLKLDVKQTGGDHRGALYAARVKTPQLAYGFSFEPAIVVAQYNEDSLQSIDKLYEDEAAINTVLSSSPLAIDFQPATATAAMTRHDRITTYHVFTPKRVAS